MSRNSLLEAGAKSEGEVTATGLASLHDLCVFLPNVVLQRLDSFLHYLIAENWFQICSLFNQFFWMMEVFSFFFSYDGSCLGTISKPLAGIGDILYSSYKTAPSTRYSSHAYI